MYESDITTKKHRVIVRFHHIKKINDILYLLKVLILYSNINSVVYTSLQVTVIKFHFFNCFGWIYVIMSNKWDTNKYVYNVYEYFPILVCPTIPLNTISFSYLKSS